MKEAFDKILERLILESSSCEVYKLINPNKENIAEFNTYKKCIEIVKEVAEEYKGDMKHNLAEMYAKNMVDYGVDITKEWQTATQQSYALEKAYIRGRQYEVDRFNELRKEYKGGWIPCNERLPEDDSICIVTVEYPNNKTMVDYGWFDRKSVCWFVGMQEFRTSNILAWQPLPEPFKERD